VYLDEDGQHVACRSDGLRDGGGCAECCHRACGIDDSAEVQFWPRVVHFAQGFRKRDTVLSSPKSPRGRMSRTADSATPITTICRAALRAWKSDGTTMARRVPDSVQNPHTTTAPRMAPRLLPEPPMMSIAQTWKVRAER